MPLSTKRVQVAFDPGRKCPSQGRHRLGVEITGAVHKPRLRGEAMSIVNLEEWLNSREERLTPHQRTTLGYQIYRRVALERAAKLANVAEFFKSVKDGEPPRK